MWYTFIQVLGLVSLAAGAQSTQTVLSNALAPSARPGHAWRVVKCTHQMANDSGSGAYLNIATWTPSLYKDDPLYEWFYLGQAVSSSYDEAPPYTLLISSFPTDDDLAPAPAPAPALAPVSRWEKVWDNSGSGSARDFALWRGVSDDPNYVVVGGIFSTNAGHAPPTAQQTDGIRAILRDLVVEDTTGQVWTDAGTGATQDGSVWKTISKTGLSLNLMIPVNGHASPPQNESYSVKRG
ncbi:hypothetical protein B0H19DRAFT_1275772 [Mycena capillaripes]|nr:hypothetical protein B0H19DRAFT_1275772 [Mycena capillaripes]